MLDGAVFALLLEPLAIEAEFRRVDLRECGKTMGWRAEVERSGLLGLSNMRLCCMLHACTSVTHQYFQWLLLSRDGRL